MWWEITPIRAKLGEFAYPLLRPPHGRLVRLFFDYGQVIPTDRGRGIFQPALDTAIQKLDEGQWTHLFPEGYVNLSRKMVLRRFKWGLSRLLLESKRRPRVVPIWIEGE
jgi:monolysocardiolipin acyltransferase